MSVFFHWHASAQIDTKGHTNLGWKLMGERKLSSNNLLERVDQNKALFRQLPIILAVNVPLIGAIAWIYHDFVDQTLLSIWCGCVFALMLLRVYLFVAVYRKLPVEQYAELTMKTFAANSVLSGLVWGSAGVLFFVPDRLDLQLIILLILIIKGAGSVSSVTSYLPSFYAYFPVSMLPICLRFLQGDPTSVLIGATALVYTVVLLVFGRNLNKTLLESLRLRHQNQHLLEEALSQKFQSEQANSAKSRFLAAASHDLRQPIYALGLFNAILEESEKSPKVARVVAQIGGTIITLQTLLDALLDISKLDAGVIKADLKHFDLSLMMKRLENDFTPQALEKGLRLKWPEHFPAVYSDEALLEQVLRNLVANAIRYTPRGSVAIEVIPQDDKIRIEVRDTGIGIASDQQREIFSEFYQVGNPERDRRRGLGLGLAIVERVMKLLGSQIRLESEPGSGSKFYFDIPCGDMPNIKNGVILPEDKTSHKIGAKIAVVEDDKDVADALSQLLQNWGCKVLVGGDIDTIFEQMQSAEFIPDLIVSDLQLSNGQNGIDAIDKIRSFAGYLVPALIVTGSNSALQMDEISQCNVPFLIKPVSPAKLRAWIRNSLKSRPLKPYEPIH